MERKTNEEIREEFKYLIENCKITDEVSEEDIKKFLEEFSNWLKENTPKKLYRYRNCADYNISSLENGEIWGSPLSSFNDLEEGTFHFNIEKIKKDFNDTFSETGIEKIIDNIEKSNFKFFYRFLKMVSRINRRIFQKKLKKVLKNENNKKNFLEKIKKELNFKRKILTKPLNCFLKKLLSEKFGKNSIYRKRIKATCLAAEYNSELLWGYYTDNYQGFVIEYDFSEIIKNQILEFKDNKLEFNYFIAPIIYTTERFDMTDILIQELVFNMLNSSLYDFEIKKGLKYFDIDKFLNIKIIFNKLDKWRHEKEWRLIINSKNYKKDGKAELIVKCNPTKVYLGMRMKEEDKNKIIEICKKNSIEYETFKQNSSQENCLYNNIDIF